MDSAHEEMRIETPIVIVGGGPVGMLTAFELSRLGTPCVLAEQATKTTKWPKMDLVNCRTMEIFKMLGIADDFRAQKAAVGPEYDFDSFFYTSSGAGGHLITSWPLPSVNKLRKWYTETNDGAHPAEPHQRCSQIVLEAWLKKICLRQQSIDCRFGWRYISHTETTNGVESKFIDTNGQSHTVFSKYLIGADGGGSCVRRAAGIRLFGAPAPIAMFLVHFRSMEFAEKRPFGRFWHMFPPFESFIIDQDEVDTFTVHMALDNLEQDISKIDPCEWVYKALGGAGEPYCFKIDEILVSSAWRPNFAITENYLSAGGKVVLAGDAAHRNPPHGGYGMNSGIEDALAIAWRLAAIHKGYGGPLLLQSYEDEQKPTMIRRLERCSRHVAEHFPRSQWYAESGPEVIMSASAEGEALRKKIKDSLDASGSECNDRGIELDSRYRSPVIYLREDEGKEPEWDVKRYTPSTFPGSRVPHVFLKDGQTSILDRLGKEWTLVSFDGKCVESNTIADVAVEKKIPLKTVVLEDEEHARAIWGYNLVLVRADGHVAWRDSKMPNSEKATEIWEVITGHKACMNYVSPPKSDVVSRVLPPLNQEYPKETHLWAGERPFVSDEHADLC